MTPRPPVAAIRPKSHEAFGARWDDPYDWLRDPAYPKVVDPEILAYLRDENAHFEAGMAPHRALVETLEREFRGRILDEDWSPPVFHRGHHLHWTFDKGAQYRRWWRREEGAPEPLLLLDEPALAEGLDYFKLADFEVDDANALLAYSVDVDGSERHQIRVERLAGRASALDRPIENTSGEIVWARGRPLLLYVELSESLRPFRVRARDLAASSDEDPIVYEEEDPAFFVSVGRLRSDRFLVISATRHGADEHRIVDAGDPFAEHRLIAARRDGHEYAVDDDGQALLIHSNDRHVNFRLVSADPDAPDEAHWREVQAGSDREYIVGAACFAGFRAVVSRVDGLPRVTIQPKAGEAFAIPFEEEVFAVGLAGNPAFETEKLRLGYSSLATPASVIDFHVDERRSEVLKTQVIPSGYDASRYKVRRLMAEAPDGAAVPISLVHRDDYPMGGGGKVLLYGYGSYGMATPAGFSANRASLLDRGFCFAIAHVRGGDEMGHQWYLDGKLDKKTNTFEDFVACAEKLIAEGYGDAGRLAMMGGSAGGLLVGAVSNMRPELFKAALAIVPFVDVLHTMRDDSLPLTPGEWTEWGDPLKDEDAFHRIRAYSPYDNVEAKNYPAILATGGLSDPRVTYWEPAKWVAKLRATKTDSNALYLRTNMGAGHFGKSGRYDRLTELAEEYAFLIAAYEE